MRYDRPDQNQMPQQYQPSPAMDAMAERLAALEAEQNRQGQAGAKPADEGMTINLVELFYYVLSKLHYVVLGAIIGAMLLGFYSAGRVVPIYSATSKLYIMGQTGNSIMADLQIGTVLTMDYQEVFRTWELHEMVNEQLGLNYSYSQLQGMLSVTNPEDTRVLYITVKNTDPKLAADIANAYATAAKRFISQTMDMDTPSTFSIALVPSVAGGISITTYVIRGVLLGTVLAMGILVLIFLLDNRPKSPEDIMQCSGLPTLAVIPVDTNKAKRKSARMQ